jgi:hypothetical protein
MIGYLAKVIFCLLRGGHQYGPWEPLGKSNHIRQCQRCGWLQSPPLFW